MLESNNETTLLGEDIFSTNDTSPENTSSENTTFEIPSSENEFTEIPSAEIYDNEQPQEEPLVTGTPSAESSNTDIPLAETLPTEVPSAESSGVDQSSNDSGIPESSSAESQAFDDESSPTPEEQVTPPTTMHTTDSSYSRFASKMMEVTDGMVVPHYGSGVESDDESSGDFDEDFSGDFDINEGENKIETIEDSNENDVYLEEEEDINGDAKQEVGEVKGYITKLILH